MKLNWILIEAFFGLVILSSLLYGMIGRSLMTKSNTRFLDITLRQLIGFWKGEKVSKYDPEIELKLSMVPVSDSLPVNCTAIFSGNATEIRVAQQIEDISGTPNIAFVNLTKNCIAFKRERRYLTVPVNDEEKQFPIAYSIQMYKDIVQVERLLRAIYRPQNVYCINVDKSSPPDVHAGMEALAKCFDNVLLSDVNVAWGSFSQVEADLRCMKYVYNKSSDWKYFLTLTGQEFPLKTNLDLVLILKALNGSNAMVSSTRKRFHKRWLHAGPPPINVTMVKGACHFAVTRGFVHYVLFAKGMKNYTKWARRTIFPDEHFFQSLGHSPQLGIPGDYTGYPDTFSGSYRKITRYTIWRGYNRPCHGKWVRSVCVYGVGDLSRMSRAYELFANKFYYNLQPMALRCLEERHYRWTREDILGMRGTRLDLPFYSKLPNVKQHIPSGLEHWS
ncbi:hypothetical protein LSH36_1718g00023 [Paralvinella palmiformis]|uniref:Uncharacterized protein n=1 Tax=Paralvinella palmiformis TaxID=53620 RepID=A0AAD9IS46_9ANNE|nr:hypothetical protein LSH36_1718g00023 [Paralvinella palmiformis]